MTDRRRIAAVAALMVAVAVVAVIAVGGGGGSRREVTIVVANANGLVRSAEVKVGGVRVGEVTGISMRLGEYPHVKLAIGDGYVLRRGARADVRLGSLAGQLNRYIALHNGGGPPLPDGATIDLGQTESPIEIDDFLAALDPKTRRELRDLLRNTVRTLDGHGPDIDRTLRHSAGALGETADLLADVTADREAVSQLVARAADGAAAVAAEPGDVQATIARLDRLLGIAARRKGDVTASLRQAPATLRSARRALGRFDATIGVLQQLVAGTEPALQALDPFARRLREVAAIAPRTFRAGLSVVDSLRRRGPAISRLVASATPLTSDAGKGLAGLNPTLDHLRARAPDALGWLPLFGDSAANYDASGHGAVVFTYFRPPPRRPIGYGDCKAGWLTRPFDRLPGQLACETWTNFADSFVGGGKAPQSVLTPAQLAPYPGEFGR